MKEFRKQIDKRKRLLFMANSILLIVMILTKRGNIESKLLSGFIHGFQLGIFVATEFIIFHFILKYTNVLKDEEKLNEVYIEETDERNCLIKQKTVSSGSNIQLFILMIATIISGYYNAVVFLTLLSTLLVMVFIKFFSKLYYRKKY